jgi:hypothetical protein
VTAAVEVVISRGESDDPRIGNPGMAEHHAHLQRMVSETGR